jgi:hypothetical protein
MKRKMLLSVALVVMFAAVPYIPAVDAAIPINSNNIMQDSPIISTTHSDLIIKSENISSNFFGSVNSVDTGYFNVTNMYYDNYHGVQHYVTRNVLGKVTGGTGGSTIMTQQFTYQFSGSNSTGAFKAYLGFTVMKNYGLDWNGPYTHNYVAMAVVAEIYDSGKVFMHYSVAYSKTPSTAYVALMDITNSVKTVTC